MKRLAILNGRLELTDNPTAVEPDWSSIAPLRGVGLSADALVEVLRLHAARYTGGRRAFLSGANLSGANLRDADLSDADLSDADLSVAHLRGADLRYANLSGADLRGADLRGADLSVAHLSVAHLRGADLRGADLSGADLSGADLRCADLPSPTTLLLVSWGKLSASLTTDLMRFDASCHPDPTAFDRWAAGGACPYSGVKVGRAALFTESRDLWSPGLSRRPYDLMVDVLAEKCPPWTEEQMAAFAEKFKEKA